MCDKVTAMQNQTSSLYICVGVQICRECSQTETSNVENRFEFFIYVHIYTHSVCIYNILYIYMHTYTQTYIYIHTPHTPPFSLLIWLFTSQTSGFGEFYFPDHVSIHRPIPTSSRFPLYMIDTFKSSREKY